MGPAMTARFIRKALDLAPRGSELLRTFDQPPLAFRLFLGCRGAVGHPIDRLPREVGRLCREFAADRSCRVGRQRLLQKKPDGFRSAFFTVLTPPQIDLLPRGPRQPDGRHGIATGAAAAGLFARNPGWRLHACGLAPSRRRGQGRVTRALRPVILRRSAAQRRSLEGCTAEVVPLARWWRQLGRRPSRPALRAGHLRMTGRDQELSAIQQARRGWPGQARP